MNCGEIESLLFKKKDGYINKRMKLTDGLKQLAYQRCLRNIHTEFLANGGKCLLLIGVTPLQGLKSIQILSVMK